MSKVKLHDKEFAISITSKEIDAAVAKVAEGINRDFHGERPLLVVILNGAFMFASDLMKKLTVDCEVTFLKLSSYQGTTSTEKIKKLIGLNEDIKGRKVIVVEDIIDTGFTINDTINSINEHEPADIKISTLLFKPQALKKPVDIDYVGFEIPNDFIVGYGLDYDGLGRNLPDIYKIIE